MRGPLVDDKVLALLGHVRARGNVAGLQRYAALQWWFKTGAIVFPRQAFITERWL